MHLTEKQQRAYADRTLSAAELLSLDDHLTKCAVCRDQLASVLRANLGDNAAVNSLVQELAAAEAEWHLSPTQLTACVDARLTDLEQEIVTSHLEVCPACQAELNDLQAFRHRLSTHLATPEAASSAVPDGGREAREDAGTSLAL